MCRGSRPDVPFICVSGEIGEEESAAIVRAGAHDFVSKSHLDRLASVVERELAAAETRRHRRQVEELTTQLAAIVEGTDDAIFSRDMSGTILTWNTAAQTMYGYTPEEAIGRPISIIVPPEFTHELVEILAKLESGQRVERMEAERMRKDGSRLRVSMTISPVKNEGGCVIGASIIARDITRRWQLEQERENLIRELQEALSKVKLLSGLLPICANCKRIRDEQGNWQQVERYVHEHSQADFTHGICPQCAKELYPGIEFRREASPGAGH
jgi:PAS domain S-box-containing protein